MRAKVGIARMNKALGEFLTESGRVEFKMLLLVDRISDAGLEHLFDEHSKDVATGVNPRFFGGR